MRVKPMAKLDTTIVRMLASEVFILLGNLFLIGCCVGNRFDITFGHYTWPLSIITPGLLPVVSSSTFERQAYSRRIGRSFSRLIVFAFLTGSVVSSGLGPALASTSGRTLLDYNAIDTFVEAKRQELKIPGMALGIVSRDEVVHLKGFGVAGPDGRSVTPQTPFQIGSVTKSFTALAVMQLVEAEEIELDAPVQRYLPWFHVGGSGAEADAASAAITVRHLLTQTSGLSTYDGNRFWTSRNSMEADIRRLASVKLSAPVGAHFQYSNANSMIAALVIDAVTGQPYAESIRQNIFEPLEMVRSFTSRAEAVPYGLASGYRFDFGLPKPAAGLQPSSMLPAGFLISTAEDLTHYMIVQLNEGRFEETSVISQAGLAELHHPAIPVGVDEQSYAMGWIVGPVNGMPGIWHNGDDGRFHAMVILLPETRQGVVLLANASDFGLQLELDETAKGAASLLAERQPGPPSSLLAVAKTIFVIVMMVPVLQVAMILWGRGMLRHWRLSPQPRPKSRLKTTLTILLPFLLNLLAALVLLGVLPKATGTPLVLMLMMMPGFGSTILIGGILGIIFGLAWPLVASSALRLREKSNLLTAPADSIGLLSRK
jgi:CubicO group peptidase (beta-lactamase class C family)